MRNWSFALLFTLNFYVMKKLFLICFALFISILAVEAQSESINRLVNKVKKSNKNCEKTDLSIPGWLIRFGSNFVDEDDLDGVDIHFLGKKISHLRIVSIENKENVSTSDVSTFLQDVKKEGFEDLMVVKSDGDDVRFMIREKKDFIRDIVLLVNEKGSNGDFVLLSLEGKFTMDDINKVMKDVKLDVNNKGSKKSLAALKWDL